MKSPIFILVLVSLITYNCTQKEKIIPNKPEIKEVFIVNKDSLIKMGIPKRITEQYVIILETQKNKQNSFFIVDTKENLIFFFDSKGKFIAKSPTIDGFDKQSLNPEKINKSLETWSQNIAELGFKWNQSTKNYVDTTSGIVRQVIFASTNTTLTTNDKFYSQQ